MNWEVIIKWLPKLAQGATLTLELVAIAVIAGLLLAIPLGIARSSRLWWVRAFPYGYIFFFRGTPLLVQLFLVYYGLAQFDAIRNSSMWPYLRDPFWCATATMTLHTAAYIAEILRGAIQAIPPGEIEAARALGMSRPKALLYIILPRAARIGLPAYSNEVILMLHSTTVAFTATVPDILKVARDANSATFLTFQSFGIAALIYLTVTFTLVGLFRLAERRWLAFLGPAH
ncbi:MAG: ABC transporter permease [Pseudomonas sp.]